MRLPFALILLAALLTLVTPILAQDETDDAPTTGTLITLQISGDAETVAETAQIIRARLDAAGYADGVVRVVGDSGVWVDLPALTPDEVDAALALITDRALLEFVDFSGVEDDFTGRLIATSEQIAQDIPVSSEATVHPDTLAPFETAMTGAAFSSVEAVLDERMGTWTIAFEIAPDHEILIDGFETFGDFTESLAETTAPLAIVLDGEVLSAPFVQTRIDDAGIITGNFTEQGARTLAQQLRAGALVAEVMVLSVEVYTIVSSDE